MKAHECCAFDVAVVERVLNRYPEWERFITAGTISLKQTRNLLNIDRYECQAAYEDMLMAGAVYGSGSNMYRASPAMKEYMEKRRELGSN